MLWLDRGVERLTELLEREGELVLGAGRLGGAERVTDEERAFDPPRLA